MKQCPACGRTFRDESLRFCLYDGQELSAAPAAAAPPPAPQQPVPPQQPQPHSPQSQAPYPQQPPPLPQQPYPQQAPYGPPAYQGYAPQQQRRGGGGGWLKVLGVVVVLVLIFGRGLMRTASRQEPRPDPRPVVQQPYEGEPRGGGGVRVAGANERPSEEGGRGGDQKAIARELAETARRAAEIEERAMSEMDTAALSRVYKGDALRTITDRMSLMRLAGQTMETRLEKQDFEKFRISDDGREAEVDLTEYWSATVYAGSGSNRRVVESVDSKPNPQTLEMERSGAGADWMIRRVVFRGGGQ